MATSGEIRKAVALVNSVRMGFDEALLLLYKAVRKDAHGTPTKLLMTFTIGSRIGSCARAEAEHTNEKTHVCE